MGRYWCYIMAIIAADKGRPTAELRSVERITTHGGVTTQRGVSPLLFTTLSQSREGAKRWPAIEVSSRLFMLHIVFLCTSLYNVMLTIDAALWSGLGYCAHT